MTVAHKKPGSYLSRGYAIRSRPLDQWVHARTQVSKATQPGQNIVCSVDLADHPVQLTRNAATMRRIIAALPACISNELRGWQASVDHEQQRLSAAVARQDDDMILHHQRQLEWFGRKIQERRDLLAGSFDMVEISSETTVTHRVMP